MTMRGRLKTAAVLALLGILAFLSWRAEWAGHGNEAEVLSLLRELKELDARWDAQAARYAASLAAGEPTPARGRELGRILGDLDRVAGLAEVASELPALRRGLTEKAAAREALEAHHAATAAALAEAVTAAGALAGEASTMRLKNPRCAERCVALAGEASLLAASARLDETGDSAFTTRLATITEAAIAADPALAAPAFAAQLALRAFVEARAREREAARNFGFHPAGGRIGLLSREIERSARTSFEERERWRIYLLSYAAALLIGVTYLAWRAHAALAGLRKANERLEKRLANRTAKSR